MHLLYCGWGIGGCRAGSRHCPHASRVRKASQIGLLILLSCLAASLYAQVPPQGSNAAGAQSPSALDCTDPLLASTSDCAGQPPQTRFPLGGENGVKSGSPNSNYSDIEQLSRPSQARNQAQQEHLSAEPLTEFQSFAASTTGQILPIFGRTSFATSLRRLRL